MKHKAKESLDILSYPAWESPCSGCKCGTSDCRDCKNAVAVLNLEDLINCQLTVEEIESIEWLFELLEGNRVFEIIMDNRSNEVLTKLQKQKEMWVSENE